MGLHLTLAVAYLVEYQQHIFERMDPEAALLLTAQGATRVS
jgi:hypothetical protein